MVSFPGVPKHMDSVPSYPGQTCLSHLRDFAYPQHVMRRLCCTHGRTEQLLHADAMLQVGRNAEAPEHSHCDSTCASMCRRMLCIGMWACKVTRLRAARWTSKLYSKHDGALSVPLQTTLRASP